MNNNYDTEISEEKKKAEKYIYLFKLAIDQMEFKNNRQQKNINKLYRQLVAMPSYEEKIKISKKLRSAFQSIAQQDMISSVKLENIMNKDFQSKHIKVEYREKINLALELANDLKGAALKYLGEYINCYWQIKLIEQERLEASKAAKVQAQQKPKTDAYRPTTTTYDTPTRTTTYEYRPKTTYKSEPLPTFEEQRSRYGIPQPSEPKPELYSSKYISENEQQKQVNESLAKLITEEQPFYQRGLTYEQKKEIRDVYKGLTGYTFAETISSAVEMNQIANEYAAMNKHTKKLPSGLDPRVGDIMKLAIDCYNVTIYEMLHQHGYGKSLDSQLNSKNLFHKLNMYKSLTLYQQTYETFMKYYNSLSEEAKNTIRNQIDSYGYEYKKIFGIPDNYPRIVDTKDIINAINRSMAAKIKEASVRVSRDNNFDFDGLLRVGTQYMTVDEVVQLYKQIKWDLAKRASKNIEDKREREIYDKEYRDKLEILQDSFIHVIKGKIHFTVEYDENMSKEQQERATRMMNIQSAMIANDFFGEELLFNPYKIRKEEIKQGAAKKKGEFIQEAEKAEKRFFGMNKFKRALAAASSYKKLRDLIEKQNVTDEDIAFAKKLY